MKLLINLFFLTISVSFHILAQSKKVYNFYYHKYICTNPNGSKEYLRITRDNKIYYSSSYNPHNDIPLTILNPNTPFLDFQKGTKVKFPNDNKVYILKGSASCSNIITCKNPDGTTQEFHGWHQEGSTYRCINPNKTIEYLYIYYWNSKDLVVKYSSSVNPNWIKLNVFDINIEKQDFYFLDRQTILDFKVKFPNDNKVYKIIMHENMADNQFPYVVVVNPDGTKQKFQWINNQ